MTVTSLSLTEWKKCVLKFKGKSGPKVYDNESQQWQDTANTLEDESWKLHLNAVRYMCAETQAKSLLYDVLTHSENYRPNEF